MMLDIVERVAAHQSLTLLPDAGEVLTRLGPLLARYAELEVRSDASRLDLITLTDAPEPVDDLLALLTARGAAPADLAPLTALARFGAGATLGMKLPIAAAAAGAAPTTAELYLRRALPLAEVRYHLTRHAGEEVAAALDPVAAAFEKDSVHMLAVDAGAPARFTAFLTTWLEEGAEAADAARLRAALAALGFGGATVERALALHALLGAARPETLFLSFPAGASSPRAKLDYPGARVGVVAELMDAVGAPQQARAIVRIARALGLDHASFAGLVLDESGPAAARAYFTRRG